MIFIILSVTSYCDLVFKCGLFVGNDNVVTNILHFQSHSLLIEGEENRRM